MLTRILGAAALISIAAPALAAGPLQVSTRLLVEHRVTQSDGTVRTEQVAAARAVPGDRVSVTLAYRNTGAAALSGVVISNPVPRGLVYRGGASAGAELSVDGAHFAPLSALSVSAPGGTRPARADDVTAVRWRLPTSLAPGAAGQFSFNASIK